MTQPPKQIREIRITDKEAVDALNKYVEEAYPEEPRPSHHAIVSALVKWACKNKPIGKGKSK